MNASISKLKSAKSCLTWKRKARLEATGETKEEMEVATAAVDTVAIEATEAIEITETVAMEDSLVEEAEAEAATANTEATGETIRTGMVVDLPEVGEAEEKAAKSGPTATETTTMVKAKKAGAETLIAIREETAMVAVAATTVALPVASTSAQTCDQRQQPRLRAPPVQTWP